MRLGILSLFLLLGCSSAPIDMEKSPQIKDKAVSGGVSNDKSSLHAKINSIDTQIENLESMIAHAKARIQHHQLSKTTGSKTIIFGIEAEIQSYLAQKNLLSSQKLQLESNLSAIQ